MIEHERSYILSLEDGKRFLDKFHTTEAVHKPIVDYYFDKGVRIRCVDKRFILTHKEGNKSDGHRFEREEDVSANAADILKQRSVLTVRKSRVSIPLPEELTGKNKRYHVTMDFIDEPMKLAVLEIEAMDNGLYPVPPDICQKLFGLSLRECPLCAWSLFRRKIGICGGPSSGKSETAKWMSHTLNTKYGANSFNVVEFATSFIQKYKKNPSFYDQFFLWYGQHAREDDAGTSNIVISDCPTFLSYIYMVLLNKLPFSKDTALYLSKIYKRVLFDLDSYTDMIFMQLVDYHENGVRFQTPDEAKEIQNRIFMFLGDHNIPHVKATYNDLEKVLSDLFYINPSEMV